MAEGALIARGCGQGTGGCATKFSTLAETCHECEHEATWPKKTRAIEKRGHIPGRSRGSPTGHKVEHPHT